MRLGQGLYGKRATTEERIRELEAEGAAGRSYTATMPDVLFAILGLVSDVGWIIQLAFGIRLLSAGSGVAAVIDVNKG